VQYSMPRYGQYLFSALIVLVFSPTTAPADETRVKELQKERLDILKKIVELKDQAFRHGEVPFLDRSHAYQQMFEAELALCENDADRIKVREKMLEQAKGDEELVSRLARAGEVGPFDLPTVVAKRLTIEIELERLKK
jgi:hypothetical protein